MQSILVFKQTQKEKLDDQTSFFYFYKYQNKCFSFEIYQILSSNMKLARSWLYCWYQSCSIKSDSVLSNIPDSHVGYYMTNQNDNWRHIYIYIWSFKTKKMFKSFLKPLWTFSYRDNKNTVNVNYSCDRNIIFIFCSHIRRKLFRNERDYRIVLTWSLPLC